MSNARPKFVLQKRVYDHVRNQFGLSAQLTLRAIAKGVEADKRDKAKQCFFRPTRAVVYDQRILSFKGLEAAIILTLQGRLTVAMQLGEYPRTQFGRGHGQTDQVGVDGVFYLWVVMETPTAPPMDPKGFIGVDLVFSMLIPAIPRAHARFAGISTKPTVKTNPFSMCVLWTYCECGSKRGDQYRCTGSCQ